MPGRYASLIKELQSLAASPPEDDVEAGELFEALQTATVAVERPYQAFARITFSLAVSKVAIDMGLFKLLANAKEGMSVQDIAAATKASPRLVGRLLRYLAAANIVKQSGPDTFAASLVTKQLAIPGFEAGVNHQYDMEWPCWSALPKFLAANGYQDITAGNKAPFGLAHNTDLHAFDWAKNHPKFVADFHAYMAVQLEGQPTWIDVFPEHLLKVAGEDPLFVDVGGGAGHQCAILKQKYPNLTRKIILQDLPDTLSHAVQTPGVEIQAHDFFTPQPVKGAAFYYIKHCLHDWPDEPCRMILETLKNAMNDSSAILIDEMIVSDAKPSLAAVNMDILLMCNAGAVERTESQWKELLHSVGLEIKEKFMYDHALQQGVLLVKRM